jgi:hypothetical protein
MNKILKPRISPLEAELNKEMGIVKEDENESDSDSDSDSDKEDNAQEKKLTEDDDEYWVQLRKRAGISN